MEEQEKQIKSFGKWHDKNYKLLLLIPTIIFLASLIYLGFFYQQNNDFFYKDISLTGGTSITIYEKIVKSKKRDRATSLMYGLSYIYKLEASNRQDFYKKNVDNYKKLKSYIHF